MFETTLKQRLYAGKAAFGVMCTPRDLQRRPAGYGFKGATAD
jgi:hypothetical protein